MHGRAVKCYFAHEHAEPHSVKQVCHEFCRALLLGPFCQQKCWLFAGLKHASMQVCMDSQLHWLSATSSRNIFSYEPAPGDQTNLESV